MMLMLLVQSPCLEKYWSGKVILNFGFALESPREFKASMPGPHSRPITSEFLGWDPGIFISFPGGYNVQ